MIKILELRTVSGTGGGPEKTIFLTAQKMNPKRFETHICYSRNRNDPEFNWMKGVHHLRKGIFYGEYVEKHPFDLGLLRHLLAYCRDQGIDVIHTHEYKTDVIAAWLKPRVPAKWVSTFHSANAGNLKLKFYQALAYRALKKADRVMTVSPHQKELLLEKGIPSAILTVLPNGVDTEMFAPTGNEENLRAEWGIPGDAVVLGFVGRLSKEKNIPLLLEAFSQVVQEHKKLFLILAGEGPERKNVEKLISELGLQEKARLVGFLENTVPFYSSIDLFVQSSDTEGMPNTVLEAMAMGLPVVATEVGGVGELIQNNEEGFLVPAGDAGRLAQSMIKLIESPTLREEMGKEGRAKVVQQFSFDARVKKLEELYEKLCQK